jgi:hypothetical protein
MPIPAASDNSQRPTPTPASDDEKAAMARAVADEDVTDLVERLERENDASRAKALLDRRTRRP